MKELITIASNTVGCLSNKGELSPQVELVLITSEVTYNIDIACKIIQNREVGQFRCCASTEALRELANRLLETADKAELEIGAFKKET